MKIGYARVSTTDQILDLQTDALTKAGCERICSDVASGAKSDRAGLAEAMNIARAGDTLVVWRLDRLGRSLPHLIATVRELEAKGIGFCSVQEAIDTTTPAGNLFFHMIGALAQFEREIIRERTKAGLLSARQRGRLGGRPSVVNEKKIRQAKAMLADSTNTAADVCSTLGISRATLYRHVKAAS